MDADRIFYCTADDVIFNELVDEGIVLHFGTEQFYGLNAIAVRAWQLLTDEGLSLTSVATKLTDEYEVSNEEVLSDLERLTAELIARQLIQRK